MTKTASRIIHVLALLSMAIYAGGVVGGAYTPQYAGMQCIPWAVIVMVTMDRTGWYFCD